MRKFFCILMFSVLSVVAGCDLQPKIASIPDDVGEFISSRYPTLLAEPDSEIYKTAVADYGVYASAAEYGNGDVTENDYILYSPADDYMMPAQDIEVAEVDVGMPQDEDVKSDDEKETKDDDDGYAPDDDIDDLKIPDYKSGKPVVVEKPKVKIAEKKQEAKTDKKEVKSPEPEKPADVMRAPVREVVVQKGDTLYSVSRKYSVPVNDLAVLNKMSAPFTLSVGQKIKVPDVLNVPQRIAVEKKETTRVADKSESVKKAEVKTNDKKNADVKTDKKVEKPSVKQDTKQNVSVVKNAKATPKPEIKKDKSGKTDVKAAKKVDVKSDKKADVKTTKQTNTKKAEPVKKVDNKKTEAKKTETKKTDTKKVEVKKSTETKKQTKLAARSASKFSWPLRGKILSGFGSKPKGLANDGINIQGSKGASVLAAENGFVAYAGNEVKGMGNLVIIQHSDGWMTVYGHMDKMNVRRGNTVTVGQKIGTVGASGRVDQPQLHFEIRKGTRAYDPISYLKK